MACDRFASEIRDYALGAALRAATAAHLAVCSDCQAMLGREEQVLATIDQAITDVSSARPTPSFKARVRGHLESIPRRAPSRGWLPSAVVAAAVVIAAVWVGRFWNPAGSQRQLSAGPPSARAPIVERNHNTMRARGFQTETTLRSRRRPRATDPSRLPRDAEILVPAQQREVVGRLFDSLRAGRPEVVSMLLSVHGAEGRADPGGLSVAPLRIEPVVISPLPSVPLILDK
jgi:hypothetical protein